MRTNNLGINVDAKIKFYNNLDANKDGIAKNMTQCLNCHNKEIKSLSQVSEKSRICCNASLEKRVEVGFKNEGPIDLNKEVVSAEIEKILEKNTTSYVNELETAFVDLTDDLKAMEEPICSVDFKGIQDKLNSCKEALGGGECINNKRFFGISWEVCQANVRNAISHKWSPEFFWNLCGKYFGVEKSGSGLYGHIQSTLNALKDVQDNITLYKQAYAKDPESATTLWEKRTGQLWHAGLNDPKTFLSAMNDTSQLLEKLLNEREALAVFKAAFNENNCCFPARQRCIQNYYESNNSEFKLTEIVYEGAEKAEDYLNLIYGAIDSNEGKYYNSNFNDMSDTDQLGAYRAAINSEIKQLENQSNKVDTDRAGILKNITDADIARYISCSINLAPFEAGDLKVENNIVSFNDGSSCSLDELQG